jgi:NAD(P)-dependent dehydrogenase (short-subunit alcohol dehydrogenase family)
MAFEWKGKRVVVTGGARGIGLALVEALVAREARVLVLDLDERSVPGATTRRCDVASASELEDAAAAAERELGGVDLLVNSAGVSVAGEFLRVPKADFDWLFEVNFFGTVNACRAFVPRISAGGHVVNVASSFAWLGFPGKSAYAASKAAVRAFTEALRIELEPRRIGVTLLFPGPVDTELVRSGRAVDPDQREREAAFLARRGLPPERVAERCLRAVERNRSRVLVGLDYRLLDWLARASPELALWAVAWLSRRMPF